MDNSFNSYLKVWSICSIIILIFRIIPIISKEKYANVLMKAPEEQFNRILRLRTLLLKLLKLFLWLSPLYLIFITLAVHLYVPGVDLIILIGAVIVLELMILVEFLYTRWLLSYFKNHRHL